MVRANTLAIALVILVTASQQAVGETSHVIVHEDLGCLNQDHNRRMLRAAVEEDWEAFMKLYSEGLASGDCIEWKLDTKVRVEDRSGGLVCLTALDSTEPCRWSLGASIGTPK